MAKKNDVCRCIARVYRWGALRPHRCSNPVWKDGYCKTHHREGRGRYTTVAYAKQMEGGGGG